MASGWRRLLSFLADADTPPRVRAPDFTSVRFSGAAVTDAGMQRSSNEDAVAWICPMEPDLLARLGALAIVSDGMGGVGGGGAASAISIKIISERYYASRKAPAVSLTRALQDASRAIFQEAGRTPENEGMGTTCVAAAIVGDQVWAAWAGDARLYLARNKALYQISEDDTIVANLVRQGQLTAAEAAVHESRHVITRALGTKPRVQVSMLPAPLQVVAGDQLLLCSDGAYGWLSDAEIVDLLAGRTPSTAAAALVAAANDKGGHDNASAVVVEFSGFDRLTSDWQTVGLKAPLAGTRCE